jgi:hypothetical protein
MDFPTEMRIKKNANLIDLWQGDRKVTLQKKKKGENGR